MKEVTLQEKKSDLAFTGERFVPGLSGEIEIEHLHRYLLAAHMGEDKDVLDIACGEGYGSHILAQVARSVCGVDIDARSIKHAATVYRKDNLSFKTGSCTAIPLPAASVDLVASFETLEHISEQDAFLQEVKRVLRPGGILLLSTPEKNNYNAGRNETNPFHVSELTPDEFQETLNAHFKYVTLVNQCTAFVSALTARTPAQAAGLNLFNQDGNTIRNQNELDVTLYLVAVASDAFLPAIENSFFKGRYGSNAISALEGGITERDSSIHGLWDKLGDRDTRIDALEAGIIERDGHISTLGSTLHDAHRHIIGLMTELKAHADLVGALRKDIAKLSQQAHELNVRFIRSDAKLNALESLRLVRLAHKLENLKAGFYRRFPSLNPTLRTLRNSVLFDRAFYLKHNPDVAGSGMDPLLHYVQNGVREKRDPHPLFSTDFYLTCNPDVAALGINPLYHYIKNGGSESRSPHPLFDAGTYLSLNPDVAAAGHNPLEHYVKHGARENRRHRLSSNTRLSAHISESLQKTDLSVAAVAESVPGLAFKKSPHPKVSIVIPVYNKSDYTLRCLMSLALNITGIDYEVIVVDDRSSDDTPERIGKIPSVVYLRNETNLGFLRSCNAGAKLATGDYIVMLNNDTVVLPDWLSALLDTFEQFPDTGLAGSMLLYPDGRLQEAGGTIWHDGSGWNIGRLQEPDMPEFNYVRDVDYCSGASIMLPKTLWDKLGGFDEHFAPAYYEDTDLAYRVRQAGRHVLYQPFSRVIHFEGISSGTDLNSGVKRHQALNHPKFVARWKDVIAKNAKPDESRTFYRDRVSTRHALVLDACTPTPDQDSGSCDTIEYLRMLKQFGYHVTFAPTTNLAHFGHYTENLQRMGIEILYAPLVDSMTRYIRENGWRFDLVLAFRHYVAGPVLPVIRQEIPRAKVVLATVDLHFLREEREAALHPSPEKERAAAATKEVELALMRQVDQSIVVSEFEQQMLAKIAPDIRATRIPIMRQVPGRQAEFAERRDVVFVGGFQHTPNIDAVVWFTQNVWPLVEKRLPECNFIIAGSNIKDEVLKLASARVIVRGFVPDLDEFLKGARLTVAPLRFGAGVKGKIVASLSHGVPCAATTVACEGMGLQNGRDVLTGDTPEELADAIVKLYTSPELWLKISDAGIELTRQKFSLDVVKEAFGKFLKELNCL